MSQTGNASGAEALDTRLLIGGDRVAGNGPEESILNPRTAE